MNLLNENDAALRWSSRLGNLAAASAVRRPEAAFTQDNTAISNRLAAIIGHFRRRLRQEHAAEKLRAQEFLTGQ
jgi:hypothetical protein